MATRGERSILQYKLPGSNGLITSCDNILTLVNEKVTCENILGAKVLSAKCYSCKTSLVLEVKSTVIFVYSVHCNDSNV